MFRKTEKLTEPGECVVAKGARPAFSCNNALGGSRSSRSGSTSVSPFTRASILFAPSTELKALLLPVRI